MTYDDPIQRAMREQGLLPAPEPALPAGLVKYFVAVGEAKHSGVDYPSTVAAVLRGLAESIENQQGEQHG